MKNDHVRKHEAGKSLDLSGTIQGLCASEAELREIISFLIQNREHQRDRELARLQAEADELVTRLCQNQSERLLECISCFKDIVRLHRQLVEQNDEQGNRGEDTEAGSS